MNEKEKADLNMAAELISKSAGIPESVYIPEYGWIMADGQITEVGCQWYRDTHGAYDNYVLKMWFKDILSEHSLFKF